MRLSHAVLLSIAATAVPAASAHASTGTVRVVEGTPEVLFRAAPGDRNVLLVRGFGLAEVWDFGAPLAAGDGCAAGEPIVCSPAGPGSLDPAAQLGDEDDVARVDVNGSMQARVSGGHGGDDFEVGSHGPAYGYGDDGNDTIRLNGGGGGQGYGGAGHDRIAGSAGEPGDRLRGGSGDDLLVPSGRFGRSSAYGEADRDRLVHDPDSPVADLLDGGAGGDVLAGRAYAMAGGHGADTIVADGQADRGTAVTAGDDRDVIDVANAAPEAAAPDSVDCGRGVDRVYADAGDAIARNCEDVTIGPAPELAGIAQARADAAALLAHHPALPTGF